MKKKKIICVMLIFLILLIPSYQINAATALLSDWSLERSAVLLGYIADRLGNIESFPFERKVPEEFIAQLNEYFG